MIRRSQQAQRGFTLLESIAAIAVMAILLAIAVPSFSNSSLSSQLRAVSNDLAASAFLARSEALKRNAVVTLCMSADGETCTTSGSWEQGWIVMSGTAVKARPAAGSGMRVSAGGITSLSFQPTGAGATAATFTVCRATPASTEQRIVTIGATGRPSIRRATNDACP